MRRRRTALSCPIALAIGVLLTGPAGAVAQTDYVDLEKRKPLGLRIGAEQAVAGSALATGDFNGDGADDLVVGAYGLSPQGRTEAGGVEVLYGPIVGRRPRARLVILGAAPGDRAGIAVADAGDLNGDGASELAIGAYQASPLGRPAAGAVHIVPGGRTGVVDLGDPAFDGQRILGGLPSDNVGRSLAGVGDQDGDGVPDLLVGAPGQDPFGRVRAGGAYVVRGNPTPGAVLDLASPPPGQTFHFAGPGEGAVAGWSVAGGNDHDGDGVPDFAIAAPEDLTRAGRVFVVSGGWRTTGSDLFGRPEDVQRVVGPRPGHLLGFSLTDVGDFDDDGLSDFAAGAWGSSPRGRRQAGQVYLLTKRPGLLRPTIMGAAEGDRAGREVAAAGDVDGDGRPDLLVGSSAAALGDAEYAGAVAIVESGSGRIVDMEEGDNHTLLAGSPAQTRLGDALAGDADLDGDGRVDVAIGMPGRGASKRTGGVLLVANPYPVRLRLGRAGRSWCRGGRLVVRVSVDGRSALRFRATGGGQVRTVSRTISDGQTDVSVRWNGSRSGRGVVRVRATGRDGRRVERRAAVPSRC